LAASAAVAPSLPDIGFHIRNRLRIRACVFAQLLRHLTASALQVGHLLGDRGHAARCCLAGDAEDLHLLDDIFVLRGIDADGPCRLVQRPDLVGILDQRLALPHDLKAEQRHPGCTESKAASQHAEALVSLADLGTHLLDFAGDLAGLALELFNMLLACTAAELLDLLIQFRQPSRSVVGQTDC
jgi:hypothetical protein